VRYTNPLNIKDEAIAILLASIHPPSWWTTERTEDMSGSDISTKRDRPQPYNVQPEKKSLEDIKMIEKACAKAKLCKLCVGLDWTRGPQRITVWTLFISAERDGCAECLILCGILAAHASFSDALERSGNFVVLNAQWSPPY
jgi:hypothetical protein